MNSPQCSLTQKSTEESSYETTNENEIKSNEESSNGNNEATDDTEDQVKQQQTAPHTYTDFGGVDLKEFLFDLLENNLKDRTHLLKIEQELISLIKDEQRSTLKFPPLSSYHRMLVHRVAAYFGLEHNIDPNESCCVIVNKQEGLRIPELTFKERINQLVIDEPKKLILKRDTNSLDDNQSGEKNSKLNNGVDLRTPKSYEEREEEYEKVRARIFNQTRTETLSNIDENEKCNSDNQPDSSTADEHLDQTGHQAYNTNNTNYLGFDNNQDVVDHQFNNQLNSQFNPQFNNHLLSNQDHHSKYNNHKLNAGDSNQIDSSKSSYFKSNGYKGKLNNPKLNLKPGNKQQQIKSQQQQQQLPFYHQSNMQPSQILNPIDQQQLYSGWLQPNDLNAQQAADCFAKQQQQQIYQQLPYNQLTHPNQQKMFLLCNYPTGYPDQHSFNDKMVPNSVLQSPANPNMNHTPVNGAQQLSNNPNSNKNNQLDKENNMNAYVTAQMSSLSIGSMATTDINDGIFISLFLKKILNFKKLN